MILVQVPPEAQAIAGNLHKRESETSPLRPASPSLRRRRLAAELRRLRDQPGLPISEVAEKPGWQPSRISRIETRQLGISAPDLRKLPGLYGAEDAGYRGRLTGLARYANERGWWRSAQRHPGRVRGPDHSGG